MGMSQPQEIKAVYDKDLSKLIEDLGFKNDFENGHIHCIFSNVIISKNNLLSIFSDGKEIRFVADNDTARAKLEKITRKDHD